MTIAAPTIHAGMDVYTRDGVQLGCIGAIWPHVPVSHEGEPLVPWDHPHLKEDEGYFRVDLGGVLGIGASRWYVPMHDIAHIGPGERLTLTCAHAECDERYAERPDFVDLDVT